MSEPNTPATPAASPAPAPAKPKPRYVILQSIGYEKLQAGVEDALAKGWAVQGGVTVIEVPSPTGGPRALMYCQAVTLNVESPDVMQARLAERQRCIDIARCYDLGTPDGHAIANFIAGK